MTRELHTATAAMALALTLAAPLAAHAADAMRVVRDPVTGEMRGPTAAEAMAFEKAEAQLRAANRVSAPAKVTGPVEIRYPDGTVETKLGEDTMMSSVVTTNADGTLRFDCLPARQAQKLVKSSLKKSSFNTTTGAKAAHEHP